MRFINKSKLFFGLLTFLNMIAIGILAWIVVPLYFEDFSKFPTMRKAMDGASFLVFVILPLFFIDLFSYGFYYIRKNNLSLNVSYSSADDANTITSSDSKTGNNT